MVCRRVDRPGLHAHLAPGLNHRQIRHECFHAMALAADDLNSWNSGPVDPQGSHRSSVRREEKGGRFLGVRNRLVVGVGVRCDP